MMIMMMAKYCHGFHGRNKTLLAVHTQFIDHSLDFSEKLRYILSFANLRVISFFPKALFQRYMLCQRLFAETQL